MPFTTATGFIRGVLQTGFPHQNGTIFKERVFLLNSHVQFSCGSYSGQGTSTTCSIASANGICDLEPIQDMLIFRTKSTALLVLAASPRQSY